MIPFIIGCIVGFIVAFLLFIYVSLRVGGDKHE